MSGTDAQHPALELNLFKRLRVIIHSKEWMCYIATQCDLRHKTVAGEAHKHDPSNFLPPFTPEKMRLVKSNFVSIHPVLMAAQFGVIMKGGTSQKEINDLVLAELERVSKIANPRSYTPEVILTAYPLDIRDAFFKLQEDILYLMAANCVWNFHNSTRDDEGFFGSIERTNIFAEQPLRELLKDWDQVDVIVPLVIEILTAEDFDKQTEERKHAWVYAQNGTISDLKPDEIVEPFGDRPHI
jgi:hypothetical protein